MVTLLCFAILLALIVLCRTHISFKDVVHRLHMNDFYMRVPMSEFNTTPTTQTQPQYGSDISINKDGSRVVMSSSMFNADGKQNAGLTQVFQYNNRLNMMEKLGQDLFGAQSNDNFGERVSMNEKGDIIAVASPYNDNNNNENAGMVQVYKYLTANNSWSQLGTDITGTSANDNFGDSISLSGDGLTMAVSFRTTASLYNVNVYKYQDQNWTLYGNTIISQSTDDINLTSQGNRVVILNSINQNVNIYEFQTNTWVILGSITLTISTFHHLTVSDNAYYIGIGSDNGDGKVVIYKHEQNGNQHTWTDVYHINGVNNNRFGQSISIDNSGNKLVVNDSEYIYVYKNVHDVFKLIQQIEHLSHTVLYNISEIDKNGGNIIYANRYAHANQGICKSYRPLNKIFSTLL